MRKVINMALSIEFVKQKITEKLEAVHVEVVDTTCGHNCGQKLEVLIVSPLFEGKGLLQRHRLVNEVMSEEIARLHAFSQKTLTPAQWTAKQST